MVPVTEPQLSTEETIKAAHVAAPVQPEFDLASDPPEQPPAAAPESPKTESAPSTTESAAQPPEPAADTTQEPAAAEASEDVAADSEPTKTSPHIKKAVEDAKREQELQQYIDNRKFFVPINAVARKRSLKVSITLIALELLLGILLLNLMLDAGLIQLLEKIPHTHLFDLQ
jgi:hypothetical protein